MVLTQNRIQILELKRLLFLIKDSKLDICIRVRFIGKMWLTDYMRIVELSETKMTLFDERNNSLILIRNLASIMQFELDAELQQYEPNFHYTIVEG
jgi:hypothetical protein